jgi:type IV pilus assembly protein PilE
MTLVLTKYSGFSLIELMVVVVIIGVLASVAVPSYTAYVENGRRAEGKAFALDIASRQDRHFTQYSRYASSLTATDETGLGMLNDNSENAAYAAVITNLGTSNTTYSIELTPAITDAECDELTLSNTGQRGAKGVVTGAIVSNCWR